MSGSPFPSWFGVVFGAVDLLHKAVHPGRWGEGRRAREADEREAAERERAELADRPEGEQ